ncbi:MAG: transposase [Armatimonadetes bacterium]|nr:transposase [Armatimonadota bacterium]
MIVLDIHSVHTSTEVKEAIPSLKAARVELFHLPSYSPELSERERCSTRRMTGSRTISPACRCICRTRRGGTGP